MSRWDERAHPRHPAGSPDSRGGEFRGARDGPEAWAQALARHTAPVHTSGLGGPWADPENAGARRRLIAAAVRNGFTRITYEARGGRGYANIENNRESELVVGPPAEFTRDAQDESKRGSLGLGPTLGGHAFMLELTQQDPIDYFTAVGAGAFLPHSVPQSVQVRGSHAWYDKAANVLLEHLQSEGIREKPHWRDPGRTEYLTPQDFDTYGDPKAFELLAGSGLSRWGRSGIRHAVMELHAAYQAGNRSPLVSRMATALEWPDRSLRGRAAWDSIPKDQMTPLPLPIWIGVDELPSGSGTTVGHVSSGRYGLLVPAGVRAQAQPGGGVVLEGNLRIKELGDDHVVTVWPGLTMAQLGGML